MLNRDTLTDEFNMEANNIIEEIRHATGEPTIDNPNQWIEDNIKKANKLLDKVLQESDAGNFSPRMVEVGSLLINSITIAYEKILSKKMGETSLQIKKNMLLLKERELNIKEKMLKMPMNQQNNIIVADREAILKLLAGEKKLLEDKEVIDIKEENN
jgi:hypothetical protein